MVRDNRFDFYKAILIIGVVWGHIINHMVIGETVSISIHTFFRTYDMPFFMAISGSFFRGSCEKYSFKVVVLNKLTMILIPSVLWSLLLSHFQSVDRYYFLTAVFFSSIIVVLIHTLIKSEQKQIVIIWLVSLLFYFIDLPLANMTYLYPFFAMGYTFPAIWDATKRPLILSGALGIFVILLCFWKKDYNIWNSGSYILGGGKIIIIVVYRMLIALVGILSMKFLLDIFFEYFSRFKINDFLLEMGRESFSIYILHCFFLSPIAKITTGLKNYFGFNIFTFNQNLLGYVIAPLLSIVIIYIVLCIVRLMKKNNYAKALLGFKISKNN